MVRLSEMMSFDARGSSLHRFYIVLTEKISGPRDTFMGREDPADGKSGYNRWERTLIHRRHSKQLCELALFIDFYFGISETHTQSQFSSQCTYIPTTYIHIIAIILII